MGNKRSVQGENKSKKKKLTIKKNNDKICLSSI